MAIVKADPIAKLTNGNWKKGPITSESKVGTTKIISGVR